MKKRILTGFAALTVVVILFSSCSKVPQVEIDAAKAAIEEAKAMGAQEFVNESYVAVQDSMKSVTEAIEAQKSKFIKNYSDAKEKLVVVAKMAEDLKQQTTVRIEEIRTEVQTSITEAENIVEANLRLLLEAPKGKEGTVALEAIRGDISIIETTIQEAKDLLENNELINAQSKINAAKEKAAGINTELREVISKYQANVKARR